MNIKALIERRSALLAEAEGILDICTTETRALSGDENNRYDEIMSEIRALDSTLDAAERLDGAKVRKAIEEASDPIAREERAFCDYILGRSVELRGGEQNMDMTNGAPLVPTTIANRVIKTIKDKCPILAGATIYNVKGNLKIPVWGLANTTHNITVAYATEFQELTADSGKFTSVDLGGYLCGVLTLVGRRIENSGIFSVVDFIVNQMAEEIALFLEGELLNGAGPDSSAATGACTTANGITAAATNTVTGDELIALQACVKQAYQANACWTMNPATFTAIKQLKDATGAYMLQPDYTSEFPYRLLGKPVHISDNMATMAASAKSILYGDYSGLAVNFRENIGIEVLREHYATQHAIGVVGWFEFDSKVMDAQRLAVMTMAAS